jgi:probable rRNA maturation factor
MSDVSFTADLGGVGVTVEFSDDRAGVPPLDSALVASLVEAARTILHAEGVLSGSVDVIAVDAETIEQLNIEQMGCVGATDVLSFPLDDPSEGDSFGFRPHVGDIVVCPEVAERQAADHAGTMEAEMHLLIIHSTLHLLGYDHESDADRVSMQAAEQLHLARFGFGHPGDHL